MYDGKQHTSRYRRKLYSLKGMIRLDVKEIADKIARIVQFLAMHDVVAD